MRSASFCFASALFLLTACGGDAEPAVDAGVTRDAGSDAGGGEDAGTPDAGVQIDAAWEADAGSGDAGPVCTTGQVEGLLDGLFFTSESDYPIAITIHPGEGSAAPTVADVRRLSGASASATDETETEDWFWAHVVVDPTRDPAIDPAAPAMLRAAFESLAVDRVVVRIIEPASSATVLVFLAGRTSCGDLVWLSSAAIET